jgi:hypothetical protein
MHVQIVTFQLDGVSGADFRRQSEAKARGFATIPGLLQKVWLGDEHKNVFGGIYVWANKASMDRHLESGVFAALLADPYVKNVESRGIEVMEAPTAATSLLYELAL